MSILDPSIIAQAGAINDPARQNALKQQAIELRQAQQQEQSQNALKKLFSTPGAIDPKTGQPTPQAMQEIMAIDPDTGMKLRQMTLEDQVKQMELTHDKSEYGSKVFDIYGKAASSSVDAYNAAKKQGRSDADAQSAARAARNAVVGSAGGMLSDDQVKQIEGSPWDLQQATALAGTDKEWMTERNTDRHLTDQEQHEAAREREEDARIAAMLGRQQRDPTATKWEVQTDPTTKKQFRYNPDTAEATTLDGKPYTPGGAEREGTTPSKSETFTPQMGSLMAAFAEHGVSLPAGFRSQQQQAQMYQGLLDRNPDLTPDQIATKVKTGEIEFGAQKKETTTAAGVAGKVEVAENEINEFLPLVRDVSAKVPRGQFVPLNKLMQMADSSISDPNLKALKIRINSLMNAYDMLASRGGTDKDKRAEVRSLLTSADSPEALDAALDSFQKEAAAAHRAAVKATKVPEMADEDGGDGSGKKPAPSGGSDYSHLWGN